MTDLRERLTRCFRAVFPNLRADQIPAAAMTSLQSWDSLATINLLALIEEEFGFTVVTDDLEKFVSFQKILEYLHGKVSPNNKV